MKNEQGFVPILIAILVPVILVSSYFAYQSMQTKIGMESQDRPISDLNLSTQVMTEDQKSAVSAQESAVTITGSSMTPRTLTVTKGTRVTFTNQDSKARTLISAQLELDPDENLDPGGSLTYTFDTVGTFVYTDKDNPSLKGTVVVK